MALITQHVALAEANDEIYLFVDLAGSRPLLKNEKQSSEHPFIKFVNARALPDFMAAIDEIYDGYGHADFISDLTGTYRPAAISPDRAREIAKYFDPQPSYTIIEKTREALEVWNFDKLQPSEDAKMNASLNKNMLLYTCMPLKDLIEAKEDLRRTSQLMAWLVGKSTFEMAHGLEKGNKNLEFKTLDNVEGTYLGKYYHALRNNSANLYVDMNLRSSVNSLHLYNETDIENTVRIYVRAAFSLFLSDETKKMSYSLRPYMSHNNILSAMWSYFATGLDKEAGSGAIGMCKHCGRFFQQARQTKKFCGNSCRVMYMKKNSGQPKSERPVETQTSRMRRKEQ